MQKIGHNEALDFTGWLQTYLEQASILVYDDDRLWAVFESMMRRKTRLSLILEKIFDEPDLLLILKSRICRELEFMANNIYREKFQAGAQLPDIFPFPEMDFLQTSDLVFFQFLTVDLPRYKKTFRHYKYLNDIEAARLPGPDQTKARLRLLRFDKNWTAASWFENFLRQAPWAKNKKLLSDIGEAWQAEAKVRPIPQNAQMALVLRHMRLFRYAFPELPLRDPNTLEIRHEILQHIFEALRKKYLYPCGADNDDNYDYRDFKILQNYEYFIKTLKRYQIIPTV